MNLIDRPHFDHGASDHRGLSTAASAALHAAVLLTLVAVLRMPPVQRAATRATVLIPNTPIWVPHTDAGGGRDSGGERSTAAPRRVRAAGQDNASAPAPPSASTTSTIEPPEEISTLPVKPMGDATQFLVGAVDSTGVSAGPGEIGAGTSPGPNDHGGLGKRPGNGFGDGTTPYGPGVTMPTLIERVAPKYTVAAMQARIQGIVTIECIVQPDGTVGDVRVMRSLDRRFGLDEEAIAAAKRWRFRPGLLNGKPVPVIVTIELMFNVR